MKCIHCGNEIDPKDRFCSKCGESLQNDVQATLRYEEEIQQFANEQDKLKSPEQMNEQDLASPMGILRAQLNLLISIYRRVEKLEVNDRQKIRVIDFDMPFWSLVNFELKAFLVGLFFMSILFCIVFAVISLFFKDLFPFILR